MPVRLPRPSDPDVQSDLESAKQGLKLIVPIVLVMGGTSFCWLAFYILTH